MKKQGSVGCGESANRIESVCVTTDAVPLVTASYKLRIANFRRRHEDHQDRISCSKSRVLRVLRGGDISSIVQLGGFIMPMSGDEFVEWLDRELEPLRREASASIYFEAW